MGARRLTWADANVSAFLRCANALARRFTICGSSMNSESMLTCGHTRQKKNAPLVLLFERQPANLLYSLLLQLPDPKIDVSHLMSSEILNYHPRVESAHAHNVLMPENKFISPLYIHMKFRRQRSIIAETPKLSETIKSVVIVDAAVRLSMKCLNVHSESAWHCHRALFEQAMGKYQRLSRTGVNST
jgi:hypothetical protein